MANEKFGHRLLRVSRIQKKLFWDKIYVIAMLLYSLLLAGLSLGALLNLVNFKNSDEYQVGQELLTNWEKNYITDIITVDLQYECPSGYEFWHDRKWPGITTGCDCIGTQIFSQRNIDSLENNDDFKKVVTNVKCTELELNSKCENVDAIEEIPFYVWKDEIKICIQRGTTSFITSPANCKEGYKRCGKGKVRFCVEESQLCPISDVKMSGEYAIDGYEKVPLSSTRNLFFTRDDKNFPISKFELTESEYCAFDDEDNISSERKDYVLLNEKRTRCSYDEPRFVVLDTQGEKDLYEENSIYSLAKSIPGYPRPNNDFTWSVGFVRYFDWKDDCRNGPYSVEEVEDKLDLSTPIKTAGLMLACALFSVLITGVITPVKYLKKRIIEEDVKKIYQKDHVKNQINYQKLFTSPRFVFDKLLKVFLFPLFILAIFYMKRDYMWIIATQEYQCGDNVTAERLGYYADKLEESFAMYSAAIVFWAILILGDIIYAIYVILASPAKKKVHVKIIHHKDGREEELPFEFETLKESGSSFNSGVHKRASSINSKNENDDEESHQIIKEIPQT